MFIKSKYIFETRRTRLKRYLVNTAVLLLGLFGAYSILCLVSINVALREGRNSEAKLFNRGPDLIVVFTGDKGRIPLAVKTAKKYGRPPIFITGVFSKNSVDTLLDPIETEGIDRDFLAIDYLARNTFENALATYRYIQQNKGISKVLIISHDYHIMRIKRLMEGIQGGDFPYEFYYTGVKTDYTSFRNMKILYKEVGKLIRTYLFLLMWNKKDGRP